MKQDNAPVKAQSYRPSHIIHEQTPSTAQVCVSGWKRSNNNAEGLHSNLTQSII